MTREERKDVIKKFGTNGMNAYVHLACQHQLGEKVKDDGKVFQPGTERTWKPEELLGKWDDITHCDICGNAFQASDAGFFSAWITSPEEAELWQEIQSET